MNRTELTLRVSALKFLAVCFLAFTGLLLTALGVANWLHHTVSLISFLVLTAYANKQVPLHIHFLVGFSAFIFYPALLNGYILDVEYTYYYICLLVGAFFLLFTRNLVHHQQENPRRSSFRLFIYASVLITLCTLTGLVNVQWVFPIYLLTFALALGNQTKVRNLFILSIFLLTFLIYALVGWSGFGRVVVLGWLVTGFLYFSYAQRINIGKFIWALVPALGSLFLTSRNLLELKLASPQEMLADSSFGPYRTASGFLEIYNDRGLDVLGFFDQALFSVLVFVPRELWPEKPYGFGFEYTVQHLDSSLVDAGHSIAATLAGEHIYYLGAWGVLTAIGMVFLVSQLGQLLYNIATLRGYAIIVLATSVPVLLWGGMTSFAARAVIPLMLISVFIAIRTRRHQPWEAVSPDQRRDR